MNIGIVGLGLIGGSFGKALLKYTDCKVFGKDISKDAMLKAELVGAVSGELNDENLSIADVVIFALAPRAAREEMEKACPKLKDGALVIDIVGNKKSMVGKMRELSAKYPKLEFISTHPMAGKEYSGISHASAVMFERASALFVPVKAELNTVARLKKLFFDIGFDFVKITTAEEHDEIIAYTSQLAHIVSSCYINTPIAERHDGYSAGSFRDLSRVARMNPKMWEELLTENAENVSVVLDGLIERLGEFSDALKNKDNEKLLRLFEEGNAKKELVDKCSRAWRRDNVKD